MNRFARLAQLVLLSAAPAVTAYSQAPVGDASKAQQAPPNATVLKAGTQLVIVDVVVEDKAGNPVKGLTKDDFVLTEDKKPQPVRNFEAYSADDKPKPGMALPPLPPGNFTNYEPVPASGPLNILLLDTLNTPMSDQSFVRYQLQQYVKKASPGTRIAIFGLGSRLYLLQGFTSDTEVLKNAVEKKLIPRASNLLDDPTGSGMDQMQMSDMAQDSGAPAGIVASLQQFEAETQSFQTQLRTQYTLDAFNALAHYLSNYPGRKNLIWFSGSFPLDIMPDPTLSDPFAVMASSQDEFRETTNLLTRAQVAVFPIDARGLMTNPAFSAANSGRNLRTPAGLMAANTKFFQSQAQEHGTMQELADDTGGKAFYNTNGLADAVAKAIQIGSNYYVLTYTPANHDWNGNYRKIKIELTGANAAQGLTMLYRHGYYGDDPFNPRHGGDTASVSEAAAAAPSSAMGYARIAMSRGAPLPEDILFKVRVLPAATTTEDKIAENNQPDPKKPMKGPYRRYDIDYAAVLGSLEFTKATDGSRTDSVEFTTFVYDNDGNLLNTDGKIIDMKMTPAQYEAAQHKGMFMHLEVSAPAKGESFLRIAVHDLNNNHFGAVEVPTSSVIKLPPPEYGKQPAAPAEKSSPAEKK